MHTLQFSALKGYNSRHSLPGPVLVSRVQFQPMPTGSMPAVVHALLTSTSSSLVCDVLGIVHPKQGPGAAARCMLSGHLQVLLPRHHPDSLKEVLLRHRALQQLPHALCDRFLACMHSRGGRWGRAPLP